MSTDIAVKQQTSLTPQNLTEAMKFSEMLAGSDLVPKDFRGKPANVLVAIQWGFEMGVQPMQALQNIAVINGRPAIWGDLGLALVKAHPDFEWIKEDVTISKCVCTIKRKGEPEVVRTFTMDDAKLAKLAGKDTYQQYPARMLQMRARWFAMRDAFPDALKGIGSAEEAMELPAEKDVTAQGETLPTEKPTVADKLKATAAQVDTETGEITPDDGWVEPYLNKIANATGTSTLKAEFEAAQNEAKRRRDSAALERIVKAKDAKKALLAKAEKPAPHSDAVQEIADMEDDLPFQEAK